MAEPSPVYRPRKPHLTPLYQCVQERYEALEQLWPERFEKRYGFWRPHLKEAMVRYLTCGDFHEGFARIRCEKCGTERILACSCKRRYLCPSCHQKRAVAFGEWVVAHVLPPVPCRHFVFSIPKILRRFFMRDRGLFVDLSRSGWQALRPILRAAVPEADPEPGAVVATQSYGDFPERFHPHLHILAPDGAFYGKGLFRVASRFPRKALERLFRHKVLRMLLDKQRISPETIRIMDRRRHSAPRPWTRSRQTMRRRRRQGNFRRCCRSGTIRRSLPASWERRSATAGLDETGGVGGPWSGTSCAVTGKPRACLPQFPPGPAIPHGRTEDRTAPPGDGGRLSRAGGWSKWLSALTRAVNRWPAVVTPMGRAHRLDAYLGREEVSSDQLIQEPGASRGLRWNDVWLWLHGRE